MVADRFGFKANLVRAMIGGGIALAGLGLARSAGDVVALQFLFGAVSGVGSVAMALAAKLSPRDRVGFGIGVVQSANAIGQSAGPLVGGLVAILVGLRGSFAVGGLLILLAVLPVLLLVTETPADKAAPHAPPVLRAIRTAPPGTLLTIGVLLVAQVLLWSSGTAAQPLVALRLLVDPRSAAVLTGVTFGLAGLLTAAAALMYSRLVSRFTYRAVATIASLVATGALAAIAIAPTITHVIVLFAVYGLARGVLIPLLPSLIGLEAPRAVLATVMGVNASAMAIGIAVGPLIGGSVAAAAGLPTGMVIAAGFSGVLTVLIGLLVREPAR
jgi:MFS family permease